MLHVSVLVTVTFGFYQKEEYVLIEYKQSLHLSLQLQNTMFLILTTIVMIEERNAISQRAKNWREVLISLILSFCFIYEFLTQRVREFYSHLSGYLSFTSGLTFQLCKLCVFWSQLTITNTTRVWFIVVRIILKRTYLQPGMHASFRCSMQLNCVLQIQL